MIEKCYNRHKAKPNSEYYIKNWYCHKPESMKELSRFLVSIKPSKINQEVSHLNRPITEKIKIVKTNKQTKPSNFKNSFKDQHPILLQLHNRSISHSQSPSMETISL